MGEYACYRGLVAGYEYVLSSLEPNLDISGDLPPKDWEGWENLGDLTCVVQDARAFRTRQAVKLALAASDENLAGRPVDWDAVEARLLDITSAGVSATQIPDTQAEADLLGPRPAVILYEQKRHRGRRSEQLYYCVIEGQREEDGEWFTRSELRKFFGARHEGMVAAYEDTLARGQVPRLPPVQAEEEGRWAAAEAAVNAPVRGIQGMALSRPTMRDRQAAMVAPRTALPATPRNVPMQQGDWQQQQQRQLMYSHGPGPPPSLLLAGVQHVPGPLAAPAFPLQARSAAGPYSGLGRLLARPGLPASPMRQRPPALPSASLQPPRRTGPPPPKVGPAHYVAVSRPATATAPITAAAAAASASSGPAQLPPTRHAPPLLGAAQAYNAAVGPAAGRPGAPPPPWAPPIPLPASEPAPAQGVWAQPARPAGAAAAEPAPQRRTVVPSPHSPPAYAAAPPRAARSPAAAAIAALSSPPPPARASPQSQSLRQLQQDHCQQEEVQQQQQLVLPAPASRPQQQLVLPSPPSWHLEQQEPAAPPPASLQQEQQAQQQQQEEEGEMQQEAVLRRRPAQQRGVPPSSGFQVGPRPAADELAEERGAAFMRRLARPQAPSPIRPRPGRAPQSTPLLGASEDQQFFDAAEELSALAAPPSAPPSAPPGAAAAVGARAVGSPPTRRPAELFSLSPSVPGWGAPPAAAARGIRTQPDDVQWTNAADAAPVLQVEVVAGSQPAPEAGMVVPDSEVQEEAAPAVAPAAAAGQQHRQRLRELLPLLPDQQPQPEGRKRRQGQAGAGEEEEQEVEEQQPQQVRQRRRQEGAAQLQPTQQHQQEQQLQQEEQQQLQQQEQAEEPGAGPDPQPGPAHPAAPNSWRSDGGPAPPAGPSDDAAAPPQPPRKSRRLQELQQQQQQQRAPAEEQLAGEQQSTWAAAHTRGSEQQGEEAEAELERRLQPEAWSNAAISGAKSLGDTVELLIKWGDGSKGRVPSRRLFGKVHCLESLVLFYETKTRKRKGNDGAAERQA